MSTADVDIAVNFYNTTNPAVAGWNNTNVVTLNTPLPLTNWKTGLPSGLQMTLLNQAPTKSSNAGLVNQNWHGVDAACYQSWFVLASGSTTQVLIDEVSAGSSDWDIGDSVVFDFVALNGSARTTTFSAAGGGSASYISTVQASPIANVPPPAAFTTTVQNDGTGKARVLLSVTNPTANQWQFFRMYASPRINSINDGTVKIGQTCTVSVSGFVPVSGTVDGRAVTGVSSTGFTIPSFSDGADLPEYGLREVYLASTGGVNSATYDVYVLPPDEYLVTTIMDDSVTGSGYLEYLSEGDHIAFLKPSEFDPAVTLNSVSESRELITDVLAEQVMWFYDQTDGLTKSYTITYSEDTGEWSGSITMVGLTATGLTARGLTMVGL